MKVVGDFAWDVIFDRNCYAIVSFLCFVEILNSTCII